MRRSENNIQTRHSDHVRSKITERAYFISLSQGFPDGCELKHWLEAEEQILNELNDKPSKAVVQTKSKTAPKASLDGKATKGRGKEQPAMRAASKSATASKSKS